MSVKMIQSWRLIHNKIQGVEYEAHLLGSPSCTYAQVRKVLKSVHSSTERTPK